MKFLVHAVLRYVQQSRVIVKKLVLTWSGNLAYFTFHRSPNSLYPYHIHYDQCAGAFCRLPTVTWPAVGGRVGGSPAGRPAGPASFLIVARAGGFRSAWSQFTRGGLCHWPVGPLQSPTF